MRDESGKFIKGHSFTDEMLVKMSEVRKGKPTWNKGISLSIEHRNKLSIARLGKEPWNKGINTNTNKDLMTGEEKICPVCCGAFYVQKYLIKNGRKKFCSKGCFFKGRELKMTFPSGEKHPSWVDGNCRSKYPPEFTPALKNKIKERDKHVCQLCGITESEHKNKFNRALSVNHIDFNKNNCDERNLNTLCIGCNTKINGNREHFKQYFKQKQQT